MKLANNPLKLPQVGLLLPFRDLISCWSRAIWCQEKACDEVVYIWWGRLSPPHPNTAGQHVAGDVKFISFGHCPMFWNPPLTLRPGLDDQKKIHIYIYAYHSMSYLSTNFYCMSWTGGTITKVCYSCKDYSRHIMRKFWPTMLTN